MSRSVVVLPGDGIGPEVCAQALLVLKTVNERLGLGLEFPEGLIGGAALDATGEPLPSATINLCKEASAIFLGAVGGSKWDHLPVGPEAGLLGLRKALGLYANLRPVKTLPEVADASPLKGDRIAGVDIMVVRELTGGIYFGKRKLTASYAYDTCEYTTSEVERICRIAGNLARKRRRKVTSVDKHNVLDTSRLWRKTAIQVFEKDFPDIQLEHLYVDAAAMHLLSRPKDFDVLVTENMFGDILTDEASMLAGSLGLLPSASLGTDGPGLYEPIHGSAPDIAGRDVANPTGAILSTAMLLRHSLELPDAAAAVEAAVSATYSSGLRTPELAGSSKAPIAGTRAFGAAVVSHLKL
ncbi:MAG: 3-isopropylmalate dehydrogenase [Gammaproteobacteria bacterium]